MYARARKDEYVARISHHAATRSTKKRKYGIGMSCHGYGDTAGDCCQAAVATVVCGETGSELNKPSRPAVATPQVADHGVRAPVLVPHHVAKDTVAESDTPVTHREKG